MNEYCAVCGVDAKGFPYGKISVRTCQVCYIAERASQIVYLTNHNQIATKEIDGNNNLIIECGGHIENASKWKARNDD